MGLGLYLARHLVQAHGGRIWVERPDDGGSRFNFTTPAVDEDD
jgi:two-component system sensor kinase FixL